METSENLLTVFQFWENCCGGSHSMLRGVS